MPVWQGCERQRCCCTSVQVLGSRLKPPCPAFQVLLSLVILQQHTDMPLGPMQAAAVDCTASADVPAPAVPRLGADIPLRLEEYNCDGVPLHLLLPDAAAGRSRCVCTHVLCLCGDDVASAGSVQLATELARGYFPAFLLPTPPTPTPTPAPAPHPTLPHTPTVALPCAAVTRMYAAAGLEDRDSHWCHLWPSALALATELLQRPALVAGRRCYELGCGLGLAGLAAALAGDTLAALALGLGCLQRVAP